MLYDLSYHSLLYSSIGSILDRAYINQLASFNSSLSSYNIVLKASVTLGEYLNKFIIVYLDNIIIYLMTKEEYREHVK